MPTWKELSVAANAAAEERGEWAGAPLPVEDLRLRVEPRYPFQGLNGFAFNAGDRAADNPQQDFRLVNSWYSWKRNADVFIFEESDGRRTCGVLPADRCGQRFRFALNTIGVVHVWDREAEGRAMKALESLVSEHAYNCYLMTGQFIETSKRSSVSYVFRRLRPTIALSGRGDRVVMLATLCLHPIGWYEDSYAGCMVPTDDVIAHLLLMRGDEHQFWKKANQHPAHVVESGI